jgi:hypothetical protein
MTGDEQPRKLDLDVELMPGQSDDDTDEGWSEASAAGEAADLRRFLDDKPPHHVDAD